MKEINIENCPDKRYYVEFLVFKNFVAAIKRHGMYSNFRSTVGSNTNNCVSSMYRSMPCFEHIIQRQSRENVFKDAKNIDDFVRMMVQTFGKCGSDFENKQDDRLLQRHIANCTNMLLHVFVERYNNDFGLLSKIGEEIFNATCLEIFGNNFVDLTQPSPEENEQLKRIHDLISAGKMPQLSPQMIEHLKEVIASNRSMYDLDADIDHNGDTWMYDDDDYNYDEEEYVDEPYDEQENEEDGRRDEMEIPF